MNRKNTPFSFLFFLAAAVFLLAAAAVLLPFLLCICLVYAVFARNRLKTNFIRVGKTEFRSPSGPGGENGDVVDVDCRVIDRKELESGTPE